MLVIHAQVNELAPIEERHMTEELCQEVRDYMAALQRKLRGCRFGLLKDQTVHMSGPVWVYYPGQVYALGRIAYTNPYTTGKSKKRYTVYSRRAKNQKFAKNYVGAINGINFHTLASTNINRAVSKACGVLVPYTPEEILDASFSNFRNNLAQVLRGAAEHHDADFDALRTELNVYGGSVLEEFKYMIESGYQWQSQKARDTITKFVESIDAHEHTSTRPVRIAMVAFEQTASGQDTAKVIYDTKHRKLVYVQESFPDSLDIIKQTTGEDVYDNIEELPDIIQGRVAVLRMVEDGHYVDEVGIRLSERLYYVFI